MTADAEFDALWDEFRKSRDHPPAALQIALMKLAFDDRPQNRFLPVGVRLVKRHSRAPGRRADGQTPRRAASPSRRKPVIISGRMRIT